MVFPKTFFRTLWQNVLVMHLAQTILKPLKASKWFGSQCSFNVLNCHPNFFVFGNIDLENHFEHFFVFIMLYYKIMIKTFYSNVPKNGLGQNIMMVFYMVFSCF